MGSLHPILGLHLFQGSPLLRERKSTNLKAHSRPRFERTQRKSIQTTKNGPPSQTARVTRVSANHTLKESWSLVARSHQRRLLSTARASGLLPIGREGRASSIVAVAAVCDDTPCWLSPPLTGSLVFPFYFVGLPASPFLRPSPLSWIWDKTRLHKLLGRMTLFSSVSGDTTL